MTPQQIWEVAKSLPPARLDILADVAHGLGRRIECRSMSEDELFDETFLDAFSGRLLAYHALHDNKLSKKAFEYAFCRASATSGRKVTLAQSATFAGADVTIDSVRLSLKTEGAKSISKNRILISKLMEARWVRDCKDAEARAAGIRTRVAGHFSGYDRVLILRAFETTGHFEYHLVEIPLELLERCSQVTAANITPPTKSGSVRAIIPVGNQTAFQLALDGSDEKITLRGLSVSRCVTHANWRLAK